MLEGDFTFLVSFLLSFLGFLSGGGAETEVLIVPWLSTAPITATLAGSTSSSSLEGVESAAFASRFSFLILFFL